MITTKGCRMTASSNRLLVPVDHCIRMNKLSYFLLLLLVLISIIITESHLFYSFGVKAKVPKVSSTSLHNKFRQSLKKQQYKERNQISHQYDEKQLLSSYTRSQVQLSSTLSVSGIESANVDIHRNDTLLTRSETETVVVEDERKIDHEMFSDKTSNPMRFAITSSVPGPQANELSTTAPTPIPIINNNLRFNSYLLTMIAKAVQRDSKKSIFCFFGAGLTGFTDVLYKLRYGCFVNMMTGNTVSLIKNGMDGTGSIINASFYISLIVAYIAGSMATARICKPTIQEQIVSSTPVVTKRHIPSIAFPKCIKIVPSVLSLFVLADIIGSYATPAYRRFGATALAFAYGLLNVVCSEVTGGTILYAVTGHMNRIAKAVNEVFAMIGTERKKSITKKIQQQQQQQHCYPDSTTTTTTPTSSTTVFDEVKFMDHIYLISFHSRVFIGFVVGVIAGFNVLSCMPVMVGGGVGRQALDVIVTSTTTQQSRHLLSNCVRTFVPMNTIIGSLYAVLLFWYGRYGAERTATDTSKQSQ